VFRAILIGVCAVLAALPNADHRALAALGGLAFLTWVVYRARLADARRIWIAYGEAVVAAVAIATSRGTHSPVLPYLLSPALALGLLSGPRAVSQGAAVAAAALTFSAAVISRPDDVEAFATAAGQWILLGLAVGLVATWARRLTVAADAPTDRYAEARLLLQQLRTVTRGLPSGLDAGSAAESLLETAFRLTVNARSAVLVQTVEGGALVPVAVRGTKRVPWRTPLSEPGALRSAWITLQPVVERRKPDKHGRREGSSLAVVPLFGSEAPFGLLVMESRNIDAFTDEQMKAVELAAGRIALRLETALLFDEVRSVATAEERDRLAREIHDGVAQELAFLGYRLDELRLVASKVNPELGVRVSDLRKEITDLISNLRLSITDLKTSVSRDRGLGAALGSYIRAIATGRPLVVHLSLQESPFRLPPDREVALFQLAQIVAQDVRQSGRAANLWVTLTVDPPSASLVVAHDGAVDGTGPDVSDVRKALEELGGSLTVVPRKGGGITVRATFEGEDDADQRPAG
jgi:signal transduction histidine kinase